MKQKLSVIAIALWIFTIGIGSYYFVRGSTEKSTDNRLSVRLSPHEKDLVLGEMRAMLSAVNGILVSLADQDMKKVSMAAKSAGMAMAVDTTPGLMAKLPLEFKTLGMSLHKDFDLLSSDIDKGLARNKVISRLGAITNKCIACHQVYRLSNDR